MKQVTAYLSQHNILNHTNQGITVATVPDDSAGVSLAKELLYEIADKRTALYLSGGRTPKALYTTFAREEQLMPGAVGMVDERFGHKFHDNSNEKMLRETGLLRYLQLRDIPFYPILQNNDMNRVETAEKYDEQVRSLNAIFHQSVAILGIGADGHTSSVAPNRTAGHTEGSFTNPMFTPAQSHLMVSELNDPKGMYKERVGMTFLGLSMVDILIVLVFGEDKTQALQKLFEDGGSLRQPSLPAGRAQAEMEVPSRFYKRPDIAAKTLFITDQNI